MNLQCIRCNKYVYSGCEIGLYIAIDVSRCHHVHRDAMSYGYVTFTALTLILRSVCVSSTSLTECDIQNVDILWDYGTEAGDDVVAYGDNECGSIYLDNSTESFTFYGQVYHQIQVHVVMLYSVFNATIIMNASVTFVLTIVLCMEMSSLQVCTDGVIVLGDLEFNSDARPYIAPLFGDVVTGSDNGEIYFRSGRYHFRT